MNIRSKQDGFSLVSAIFIVVVVAMIAGFMVNIGSIQRATPVLALMGLRAGAAAASGMEWTMATVLDTGTCPAVGTDFGFTGTALEGFTATIECRAEALNEGARSYTVFQLTVTAEAGQEGTEDYFRRRLTASVSNAL
jgi:MSHA biogenesis protein MshP